MQHGRHCFETHLAGHALIWDRVRLARADQVNGWICESYP